MCHGESRREAGSWPGTSCAPRLLTDSGSRMYRKKNRLALGDEPAMHASSVLEADEEGGFWGPMPPQPGYHRRCADAIMGRVTCGFG